MRVLLALRHCGLGTGCYCRRNLLLLRRFPGVCVWILFGIWHLASGIRLWPKAAPMAPLFCKSAIVLHLPALQNNGAGCGTMGGAHPDSDESLGPHEGTFCFSGVGRDAARLTGHRFPALGYYQSPDAEKLNVPLLRCGAPGNSSLRHGRPLIQEGQNLLGDEPRERQGLRMVSQYCSARLLHCRRGVVVCAALESECRAHDNS
jgi:hypothetical protein